MRSIRFGLGSSLMVTLFAAMAAACGGDDGGGNGNFIGEWQYTSGTTTTTCQGEAAETEQLVGEKVRISKGIDSPLVLSETDSNCTWKMTVNGSVATIATGQSCTESEGGISATLTYTAGTFTVTGTTGTFSGTANAMVNIGGAVVNCTVTGSGGLNKVAN